MVCCVQAVPQGLTVRVMSYNLLADELVSQLCLRPWFQGAVSPNLSHGLVHGSTY